MSEKMMHKDYMACLGRVSLFKYLTDDEIDGIAAESEVARFDSGERIISQGHDGRYLFIVLKGSVFVTYTTSDDEEIHICTIKDGDIFGETAIFMDERRTANVTGAEETVVMKIHRSVLLALFKDKPRTGVKLLMLIINSLLHKLRNTNIGVVFQCESDDVLLDDIDPLIKELIDD